MGYTATTTPSIVGIYVNKFIDTPNSLSFIEVTNIGSGYGSRPTTYIDNSSGANGSGALLEPIFVGGKVMGIHYVYVTAYDAGHTYTKTDSLTTMPDYVTYSGNIYKYINNADAANRQPNTSPTYWQFIKIGGTGTQRGTGYSNGIAPYIRITGGSPSVSATAVCYLTNDTTILGKSANENKLINFCLDNGINHMMLYDLNYVNWGGSNSSLGTITAPGKQMLANFIAKARLSGITHMSADRNSNTSKVNEIVNYNSARGSASEKFDWFCVEHEWWNDEIDFASFQSNLIYIHNTCTANSISVEVYVGWPSASEVAQMIPYVERIQYHDYSPSPYPDYGYTKNRLIDCGNACAAANKVIEVGPIFSAEHIYSPWNSDYNFMGQWYSANTINQGWIEWAILSPNSSAAAYSYNLETNSNVRNFLNPIGHFIFSNTLVRGSNNLLYTGNTGATVVTGVTSVTTCNPSITYSTSLVLFSGQSVVLSSSSANSYFWTPNNEVTQVITATTAGTYTVRVTGTTCTGQSSVVVYSAQSGGTCVPNITFVGNPYFTGSTIFSGQSILLSSITTGTTYLWNTGGTGKTISAITSGSYFVTVDSGTGCTGTSSIIDVSVLAAPDINILFDTPIAFPPGGSVTLSASSGSSYTWYPNGETTSTISVTGTGSYYVMVDVGSGYTGTSEVVYVNANYVPPTTLLTENIINANTVSNPITYADGTTSFATLNYSLFLSNPNVSEYYVFVKIRRKNSLRQAGIKVFTEQAENFIPITNKTSNNYSWYRLEANGVPITVRLNSAISNVGFQAVNDRLEFIQFALSQNDDYIAGPYPITTP